MKVTVVGSYKQELSDRYKETPEQREHQLGKFEEACRAIGRALAEEGHRLVVAHSEIPETAEALALSGFKEKAPFRFDTSARHEGDADLKAHLDAVEDSDVVILIGGGNGTYASGLSALRRRKVIVPIPAFGGSARDLCEIKEIGKALVDEIKNLDLDSPEWIQLLTVSVRAVLNQYPRVLIIHGRGDTGEELRNMIMQKASSTPDALLRGLAEPVIMNLSGSGAVTVPSVFEDLASQVAAAIVIVTADDIGGFARWTISETVPATALELQVRARENVWVEVGWFWGRLGREKIFLWLKDTVEIPSDLQGVARTEVNSLAHAWPSISSFLVGMRTPEITAPRAKEDVAAPQSPPVRSTFRL